MFPLATLINKCGGNNSLTANKSNSVIRLSNDKEPDIHNEKKEKYIYIYNKRKINTSFTYVWNYLSVFYLRWTGDCKANKKANGWLYYEQM
jgi:hypothetical protein